MAAQTRRRCIRQWWVLEYNGQRTKLGWFSISIFFVVAHRNPPMPWIRANEHIILERNAWQSLWFAFTVIHTWCAPYYLLLFASHYVLKRLLLVFYVNEFRAEHVAVACSGTHHFVSYSPTSISCVSVCDWNIFFRWFISVYLPIILHSSSYRLLFNKKWALSSELKIIQTSTRIVRIRAPLFFWWIQRSQQIMREYAHYCELLYRIRCWNRNR